GIRDFHVTGVQTCTLPIYAAYGLAIQDQIKRMGLEDDVTIVYEPLSAEFPASLADLILFPARAELPQNGSKQIFEQGIPVVAFEIGRASWRERELHPVASE